MSSAMFSDFADTLGVYTPLFDYESQYLSKSLSAYNNERKVYSRMTSEAINKYGVQMEYYVTSWNVERDKIWGEDEDRKFARKFKFMGYYSLPREDKLWSKFGIDGMDTFSIFVSKLHLSGASTYDFSGTSAMYDSHIPIIGDVVKSVYNNYLYQITEVKEEVGMFLLSKQHVWEFIVKPYFDEHISLSADTSATMIEMSAFTDRQTDIFNVTSAVDAKKPPILYVPKATELNAQDPWEGY